MSNKIGDIKSSEVEVCISGIGGYFPKSSNVEELKDLLMEQVSAIEEARWKLGQMDVCDMTGNTKEISNFDASYFGIHRKQARFMDPMQRLMLQNTYEAIIDAGVNPMELRGKRVGVFTASSISENDSLMFETVENGFGVTGQARCMMANRISYWLNVTGPSCSIFSSWVGGMEVIKYAFNAIRLGQCDAAIVGSGNLTMNVHPMYLFKLLGFTCMDGKTKAFDEKADGYARSDGICVFYIQKAKEAKRHYATVVNVDVQYNGIRETGTVTDLQVDQWTKFLSTFYQKAQVDPSIVQYIETYGCGIKIIDEKELNTIDRVFNAKRTNPLPVGSVKTNIGHSEASSDMLNIAKVIIAMETGVIPGSLHYETPNKNIPALVEGRIQVVDKNTDWEPHLAAVNGLGLACTMAHILLKANPRTKSLDNSHLQIQIPLLNTISTRTEEGIKEILTKLKSNPNIDLEYSSLINSIASTSIPGHLFRGYTIQSPGQTILDESTHFSGIKRQIWFVYSGMGSQWASMGKDLMKLPVFAESIEKCHDILMTKGLDLKWIITENDPTIFNNILHSFVGIAAIQIGLTDVLNAIGIIPDGLIGHSVGELGCAYADGCLTSEQMILSAYYRGKASLESELITGMMAAVGLGAQQVKDMCPESIDIACHNSAESCTISGPKEIMEKFVSELQSKNIFARLVNVSNIAYHSRYIKPAAPALLKYLKEIIPTPPVTRSSKWISTSVPEASWETDLAKTVSAEYLTNNLLSSVYFEEGSKLIPKQAVVIEIAPHGLLQAILRRSLSTDTVNIPLTRRDINNTLEFLFTALGKLYINGVDMNLPALYPKVQYPVSRGTKSLAPLVRWAHTEKWRTGIDDFKDYSFNEVDYPVNIKSDVFRNLTGHQISNQIIIPVTSYLPLVYKIISNMRRVDHVIFEDVIVKRHIIISKKEFTPPIHIMVLQGTGHFEISDRYGIVVQGRINIPESYESEVITTPPVDSGPLCYTFSGEDLYKELKYRGYQFGDVFNSVQEIQTYQEGARAKIDWKNDMSAFIYSMLQLSLLRDGEFQTSPVLPTFIRRILINFDQLPETHQQLQVNYHYTTGLITSDVIQIKDVQCDIFHVDTNKISVDSYEFIQFHDNLQDIQTGIDICLQIVQDVLDSTNSLFQVTEIKTDSDNTLENYVSSYSERHFASKIEINAVNEFTDNTQVSSLLTIISQSNTDLFNSLLLNEASKFVLIALPADHKISITYPITSVYSFVDKVANMKYHLLRKTCESKLTLINIDTKYLNSNDLKNSQISWVQHLLNTLKTIENDHSLLTHRVYLVSKHLPENGIEPFLKDVRSVQSSANVIHLMFLLDDNLPKCRPEEPFYQSIFQKDYSISVYKDGVWRSYFKTPFVVKKQQINTISTKEISNMFHNYEVKYLGLNVHNVMPLEKMEDSKFGPVEFSGYDKSGREVMGIAKANMEKMEIIPDPNLIWPVLNDWSLVDAATIPYSYTMAYYILFELVQLIPGETLLINNGSSSFGQALIQIAYRTGCSIYTTVGTDKQRALLLDRMKMLSPTQILYYNDSNFDEKLLELTNGCGVNVIVNCLPRNVLQLSANCLSKLGRIVQIELSESDSKASMGLHLFLSCTGMHGVVPKNIFNWSPELKAKINEMVLNGMKEKNVTPLSRVVHSNDLDVDKVLQYLKGDRVTGTSILPIGEKQLQLKSKNFPNYKCNQNASYIICGEDIDMLLATTRYIASNNAKLIVIFANLKSDLNFISHRLTSLKYQYETEIKLLTGTSATMTEKSLKQIHNQKPVDAVFVLPKHYLSDNLKSVKNIDSMLSAVNPNAHLICFWGVYNSITYKRQLNGMKISNLKWDKKSDCNEVVQVLDDVLIKPADIFIRHDDHTLEIETNLTSKDFFTLLSNSKDSILSIYDASILKTQLIPLMTNGIQRRTEIPPIFIVPGLLGHRCKYFKQLQRKFMGPAYVINVVNDDQLESIVKEIKSIYHGPYNLIGISFGGALAIEIIKRLEAAGEQTQLYLLDGVPETVQHILNESGSEHKLYLNVIKALLQVQRPEHINTLLNTKSWTECVDTAVKLLDYTPRESKKITQLLDFIKTKLDYLLKYKSYDQQINGLVYLLRPVDSSKDCSISLSKCCQQIRDEVFRGNHFTMLQNDQLAHYINENLMLPGVYV